MSRTVCKRLVFWLSAISTLCSNYALHSFGEQSAKIPLKLRPYLTADLISLFEPGALVMPQGAPYRQLEYQLFKPVVDENTTSERFPLVVFFPGQGEVQTTNGNLGALKDLQATIFTRPDQPSRYQFYFLVICCPVDSRGKSVPWFNDSVIDSGRVSNEPIVAVMRLLDEVVAKHPIDSNRISLLGISSGGAAIWELGMRYPSRFAAIVPCAALDVPEVGLDRMRDLPVWAFHSSGNQPERVMQSVARLKESGGNAALTLLSLDTHNCWIQAFAEYEILDWMLAQARNTTDTSWRNSASWKNMKHDYFSVKIWWSRLVSTAIATLPILIVIGITILYRRELARHVKSTLPPSDNFKSRSS